MRLAVNRVLASIGASGLCTREPSGCLATCLGWKPTTEYDLMEASVEASERGVPGVAEGPSGPVVGSIGESSGHTTSQKDWPWQLLPALELKLRVGAWEGLSAKHRTGTAPTPKHRC